MTKSTGWWQGLIERAAKAAAEGLGLRARKGATGNSPDWLIDLLNGTGASKAGASVTAESGLHCPAVYSCISLIASAVASLPLNVFERKADGTKRQAPDHPIRRLFQKSPNADSTAIVWREAMQACLLGWGNAYAEIQWRGDGMPEALWLLRPDRTVPKRLSDGRVVYEVRSDRGGSVTLESRDIFHLPALSFDGLVGKSPVTLAREAVGLALAAEAFGSKFFGNGARAGSILEHPGTLSEPAQDRLKHDIQKQVGGEGQLSLLILEEGMKFNTMSVPPEDAQFLETRKFQAIEIARMFHVPPHKMQDLERGTFSNIEHQAIEFVVDCLRPWLIRWEQEIKRKLLVASPTLRAEFVVEGLLRGDTQSRYAAYGTARQWGWMSANDIRRLENLDPIDGGDIYLQPVNMIDPSRPPPAAPPPARSAVLAHRALLVDRCANLVTREVRAMRKVLKAGDPGGVGQFYAEFPAHVREVLAPALAALAETMGERRAVLVLDQYLDRLAAEWAAEARATISGANGEGETILAGWERARPAAVADRILRDFGGN